MVDWSRMRGRRQIVSGPGLKLLIGLITNRKGGNVWVLREIRRSLTGLNLAEVDPSGAFQNHQATGSYSIREFAQSLRKIDSPRLKFRFSRKQDPDLCACSGK
jgi:hypothetical protein